MGLAVVGAIAGVLMIVSELTTVASVDVGKGSCQVIYDSNRSLADRCSLSGLDRHGGALILIGVLCLLMAWGAGLGGSRPAGGALVIAGALVLGIGILSDIPVTDDTGAIGQKFEGAKAMAGLGLYLELAGGALAVVAGLASVLRRAGPPLAALVLLLLVLAGPAAAQGEPTTPPIAPARHVDVGIGDNRGSFLGDPVFDNLGVKNVRLIVPYDVVRTGGSRLRGADGWLQAAHDRGLDVLVSFGFSGRRRLRWHLPTPREYRVHVRAFMRRYPWIHEYTTWNEANHTRVQPSGLHPVQTAILYRVLRRLCLEPDCQTVAADILLSGSARTWRWIKAFQRRAGRGPHIWGLHNYPDANSLSARQTRRFLRTVRGEVWFTETGGIVHFGKWKRNERRAARAVAQVFRLADLSPRVKRVYLYSWRDANRRWDSALLTPRGGIRPAYLVLLNALALDRFNPRLPVEPPPPDLAPAPDPPAQTQPGGPS